MPELRSDSKKQPSVERQAPRNFDDSQRLTNVAMKAGQILEVRKTAEAINVLKERTDGISMEEQGKKTWDQALEADAPDAPDRPDEPIFRDLTNIGKVVDEDE